jgi:hypothetical protein
MAKSKELTKEERISKEINRLKKIFTNLEKNKLDTVMPLIRNAAFMSVTLDELQKDINEKGVIDKYQNGEHQFGTKKNPQVEVHIAMTKNYASIIKQLVELVPAGKKKESRLSALMKE